MEDRPAAQLAHEFMAMGEKNLVLDLVMLSRLEPEAQDAAIDRIEQALRRSSVDGDTMAGLRFLAKQVNEAAAERLKLN